ncbi:putative RNA polymerase II subunit B1 CTD phosphatase rpap2 [Brachyhypopomus gauderio]|uniref:putative RNA polymerase II subunit B1 CTD phosphatase rpap2 n=1 Tax=Brachyhypopomus gauderio TaxID=698409 RepID=UPI004041D919
MTKAETNDGIVLIEESMEPRNRRQVGASKTKKKGGQPHTRSAAEEAKRREVLKETLREKLELERRALQVVERLLDDNVTEDFLIDCAQLITPANYRDTVEERSIVKLCGYPICPNKLICVPTQQYKISTRTNKVYDITERKCFCSNSCYKASKFFEVQISKSPLWLRKEERPADVKLMKKEDGGSSGLEVPLMDRAVRAEEVENPVSEAAERLGDLAGESEEEQEDFVSSVVARRGTRVHWGELPRHHGGNEKDQWLEGDTKDTQAQCLRPENGKNEPSLSSPLQGDPQDCPALQSKVTPVEYAVEETRELLDQCVLSDTHSSGVTPQDPVNDAPQKVSDVNTDVGDTPDTGLNICQVGMSRRGATELKSLLKNHRRAKAEPLSVKQDLLEALRRTLLEWRTEETLKFLYGPEYTSQTDATLPIEEEEEELDEDDLEDLEGGSEKANRCRGRQARPSSAAPDYHTLRKDAKLLDLRVREFYKGACVLSEEVDPDSVEEAKNSEDSNKGPVLPLVDSQAPHVIQKRIVVEKLSRSLRDIVGPLRVTMSEIINDINSLVRTFRFTNVNISHKPPEWTLIAVVLLSVLTEVSPLLKASMVKASSVEYITSLMKALRLDDQDLQNLVLLFKPKGQVPSSHLDV